MPQMAWIERSCECFSGGKPVVATFDPLLTSAVCCGGYPTAQPVHTHEGEEVGELSVQQLLPVSIDKRCHSWTCCFWAIDTRHSEVLRSISALWPRARHTDAKGKEAPEL